MKEFPRRLGTEMLEWRPFFSAAGDLYDWLTYRTPSGPESGYARYDTLSGTFVDTIPSPHKPAGTPFGWGYKAPTPRGWWMGVGSEYRLWQLTWNQDTVRVVYRHYELTPQTPEQRDSARQVYRDIRRRSRTNIRWELPDHERIFDWIVVDDQDYVWVGLAPEADGQGVRFDVFSPEGLYLGALPSPYRAERSPAPVIRDDHIAFVTKNELDVPFVVKFRIARDP